MTERLNWGGECAETIIRGCSQLGGAWHVWGPAWVLQDYWNQWAKAVLRPGPTVGSWRVPCLSCPWEGLPSSCGGPPGPSLSALVTVSAGGSSARQRPPKEHSLPGFSWSTTLPCSQCFLLWDVHPQGHFPRPQRRLAYWETIRKTTAGWLKQQALISL